MQDMNASAAILMAWIPVKLVNAGAKQAHGVPLGWPLASNWQRIHKIDQPPCPGYKENIAKSSLRGKGFTMNLDTSSSFDFAMVTTNANAVT
jgi:hypothetical protein